MEDDITDDITLVCKICGKKFKHLGSHLWHKHGVLAREYKEEYELPYNMALIAPSVKEKKQKAFEERRDHYLKNLLVGGKEHQFKKGRTGQRRVSERERKTILKRIQEVNRKRKPETCPICKIMFDNLDSHLCNKHGLLRIKNTTVWGKK